MLLLFVVAKGQKDHGLVLVNLTGSASLAGKELSVDVESFSDNTGTHQVLFTASLASHSIKAQGEVTECVTCRVPQ